MRLIKNLLLAGGFVVALGSCKKSTEIPANVISYKVDGVLKTFKPAAYYYADNSLLIYGGESGNAEISLYIYTNTSTEDFNFNKKGDSALGAYQPGGFISDTGKLVINSFDCRHISGTFQFRGNNGRGTKSITEGQFTADVINFTHFIEPPEGDPSVDAIPQK